MKDLYKRIPKIDIIIENSKIKSRIEKYGRDFVLDIIRDYLDNIRKNIKNNTISEIEEDEIIETLINKIDNENKSKFKKVINGTGVIIHTNLGRSIFSDFITNEICGNLSSYTNLEYNLNKGERGHRYDHITDIICKVTGAEDAVVVNNNAAAVLITLKTIAEGKEVIVSRGEQVEIGGSFRIPDVIKESGCILKEVGTTNKTHLKDYENAINENTGAIIKIHTSNYKIVGFSKSVETEELKELSAKYNIPLIEDLGSGMLLDLSSYGLSKEPTVQDTLNKGIDVVTFSGDKLLGGPQCGIIVGAKKYIENIKYNQLLRALRVDKFTIMALESTFKAYLNTDTIKEKIPTIRMITEDNIEVKKRAQKLNSDLKKIKSDRLKTIIKKCDSKVGGGAYPLDKIDSWGVEITVDGFSEGEIEGILRCSEVPIIIRIEEGKALIDCKTIVEKDYLIIKKAFKNLLGVIDE